MDQYRFIHTLENLEHIGTPPHVALRLNKELGKADIGISDAVSLLQREQTICAQILKVANSVHYSRGHRIQNLTQAVSHLGTELARKIVLAVELIGIYRGEGSLAHFSELRFWKHTLAGAGVSREIALRTKASDIETCFIAAMLRNIGVLAIRQYFPDTFRDIIEQCRAHAMAFSDAAKSIMKMDQYDIAYLVGVRWNLPEKIVFSIRGMDADPDAELIRRIMHTADTLLLEKQYALWDPHYNFQIQPVTCYMPDDVLANILLDVDRVAQELF
jgi:HD-like signal output (HDOD) protein